MEGEPLHEEIAALCEEVTEHKMSIAKMRESMARKRGEKVCAACGAALPKDARFCLQCGAECEEETEEEVVEDPKPASEEKDDPFKEDKDQKRLEKISKNRGTDRRRERWSFFVWLRLYLSLTIL